MLTINETLASYVVHNPHLAKLIRGDGYSLSELEEILEVLSDNGTLDLVRWDSGGSPAVTPIFRNPTLAARTVQNGLGGWMEYCWLRDLALQLFAEWETTQSPLLMRFAPISPNQWKRGVIAPLRHYDEHRLRFINVILAKERLPAHLHPNVVVNGASLDEVPREWGNTQHDAHALFSAFLHARLSDGSLDWNDPFVRTLAQPYISLLHAYHWRVNVWSDQEDLGCWESRAAQHWSSVAAVAVGASIQEDFLAAHGNETTCNFDGNWFNVHINGVREVREKCLVQMGELGDHEFIRSPGGGSRKHDVAKLNALYLQALTGKRVIDDARVLAVIAEAEELMGAHGCRRFLGPIADDWDGRHHRGSQLSYPEQQPQWCHPSPECVSVLVDMWERTGDPALLDRAILHFNRGLAAVNEEWLIPESYIVDHGEWISNENRPLAWAQSVLRTSFVAMERVAKRLELVQAA